MLDYLAIQGSTENPTFVTIVFTVLLAFVLSSLIAWTFDKTTEQVIHPVAYLQSLVLVSIVAATVMQAIGDSLARGLGMLGALAIIRFRTTLRTPRNMVFTFASLSAGIACGVYGYTIGIVGTIGFCLFAFILRYSPWHTGAAPLVGVLRFEMPKSSSALGEAEDVLNRFCKKYKKIRFQIANPKNKKADDNSEKRKKKNKEQEEENVAIEIAESNPEKSVLYEYQIKLKKERTGIDLDTALSAVPTVNTIKINFENTPENV